MKDAFNETGKLPQNVLVPTVRDKDGSGWDIFSLLLKQRIVLVQGQVETAMASTIIASLKFLESQGKEPITMLVNSPGGSVVDGLAIVDIMREIKCPVHTVGNGMQASMGSIILAAGDERRMTKNSMVLVHQIMGGASSGTQHSDFEISAAFMAQQHEALKSVYVEFTGLNHKFWDIVGERDTWLTADQAKKIGYVHSIVKNEKPGGPYAAEATRPVDEDSLQGAQHKATQAHIDKMTAEEIARAINSGAAEGGVYSRLRGELVVRLAEFPEFWTEKRKQEHALKAAAPAAANDDAKKPAAAKATVSAPAPKM